MKPDPTVAGSGTRAALQDLKYDVRSLFIRIHCFQPTDRDLKALLKAQDCPSDLRRRQSWQELHARLRAQQQAQQQAHLAAQKRWEARAKPWAQWLTGFQQALQSQAGARERRWQEARDRQTQQYFRPQGQQQQSPSLSLQPWRVLGLDPETATADEIKHAYRRLALQYHPDRGGCADRFQEIHRAYELLLAAAS